METAGFAQSDGGAGEQPDQLPSETRIGRRADMEKTKNVRMRGLTRFAFTELRYIGMARNAAGVGLCNLAYNMKRYIYLLRGSDGATA